jgi:hypothetical protein
LRYVLGDSAHRRTHRRSDGRISFEFDDADGKAAEVAELFFTPEGIATSSARELLACDREVRATVSVCINDGEWRNG